MSNFRSDKCTKEELKVFKAEVLEWLEQFDMSKFKIRAFKCYNGEVRLYDGTYKEFENHKSSFRKTGVEGDKIVGTRGHHTTRYADYISIDRDEFTKLKTLYKNKKGEEYDFFNDIIFNRLTIK